MKKVFLGLIATILINGCGSGSTENNVKEELDDINMTIGTVYNVFPKNKILKHSEDALVKISHTDGEKSSTVILLSGNATIIRKP